MNHFILLLATGFGVGYSPFAPGTMGAFLAIPFYLYFSEIPSPLYELTLLTFFFLSGWISGHAERYFGKKDDPRIVIDEVMGFFITMLWVNKKVLSILIGFLLFRLFDILKPFPIRYLERRWRGGFGIVLDDVIAGVYVNVILHLLYEII
jgi:phosphatidylglycerophosphatase A